MNSEESITDNTLNISSIIKGQLLTLIKLIKDTYSIEKPELDIDIKIQIFSIKKIDDKKREKIFYSLSLNDDKYKYGHFILMENEISSRLKSGDINNLKKIISKRVQSGLYIMIKELSIISSQSNNLPNVKMIIEKNNCFIDENGKNVEESKKNIKENNKKIQDKKKEIKSYVLNFDKIIEVLNDFTINKNKVINKGKKYYTLLKELTTFSRDFIIFVRIIKKSEIKVFETRNINDSNILTGQGKLFYFTVLDKEGNEMQCTCFNKSVDKLYNLIEENKLYEIKGGYVKINDKKYTRIKSDYKIILDENSTITRKSEDNSIIKKNQLNIIHISDLQYSKIYTIVDICAIVLDSTDVVMKSTRNGLQPLKKLILGDTSKYQVELSLWRMHSQSDIKIGDILLINNVKIGEYKGRNLSTFEETSIKINPSPEKEEREIEEYIYNLNKFKEENKDKLFSNPDFFSNFEKLYKYKKTNSPDKEDNSYKSVYIMDILEFLDELEEPKNLSKITATVTQLLHNEKNFYIGCNDKNCKKKLVYDFLNKYYTCSGCGKKTKKVTYYYNLNLRIKDASCEYWVDIFGKNAENIMQCTAEEYKNYLQKRDKLKLQEITDKIEFKNFNFWIRPKIQMFNTISKKKLYTWKIEPLNRKEEAHKLIGYLEKELNILKK